MLFVYTALFNIGFALDINVEKYHKVERWNFAPDIIVCKNAPVTVEQVQKAVDAWKEKGIPLGTVRKQQAGECGIKYSHFDDGKILIAGKLRFLDKDLYNGWTVKYTYTEQGDGKDIVTAICEINDDTVREKPYYTHKLLIHEIGHAIGYPHQHHSQNDVMSDSLKNVY